MKKPRLTRSGTTPERYAAFMEVMRTRQGPAMALTGDAVCRLAGLPYSTPAHQQRVNGSGSLLRNLTFLARQRGEPIAADTRGCFYARTPAEFAASVQRMKRSYQTKKAHYAIMQKLARTLKARDRRL